MKNLLYNLLLSLMLFGVANVMGQQRMETDVKIDPRQYVSLLYKKTYGQVKMDTVWNWENRKNVPNQKVNILDVDGEIRIDFSRIGLISNKDFEGTVSLEADISGASGTRKIEVNPYSEVGVQRIPIGIKSEAPLEISKKLLNMIRELRDANATYDTLRRFTKYNQGTLSLKKKVDAKLRALLAALGKEGRVSDELRGDAAELELLVMVGEVSNWKSVTDINTFKSIINTKVSGFDYYFNPGRTAFIQQMKPAYEFCIKKTDIVISYLNSFEAGGEDATKAFLSLVNKDLIGYRFLKNSFINAQKKLALININYPDDDLRLDSVFFANASLISETCHSLSELARFKGSTFENILNKVAEEKSIKFLRDTIAEKRQNQAELTFYFDLIDKHLVELSEELSEAAGKMIYKKLVYATIDLGKSGAKSGEVLNVYLTWILDSKRDSLSNSPRLPIGKYFLRETGWRMEVADMFALVKRINEKNVDAGKVSPSNFKGSGGAVLMWTFNKQDRGLSIKGLGSSGEYSVKRKNRFINFLEPSIGLNVSYLDFSTDKDVEIGTGLQLGLFKNKIFFGQGLNLHMLSPGKQSPGYFYIGFSFARLSDLFKDSSSVTSMK